MNVSNFEHAAFALLMQIAIGLATGNWWAGAAAGAFFFLGREHAQREYKLGTAGKSPWPAFDFFRWSLDAKLDLLFPAAAVIALALVMQHVAG